MSSVLFDSFHLSSNIANDFGFLYEIIQPLVNIADGASTLLGMFV